MVHATGEGKIVWSGPDIIVMIALGRKKLMQFKVQMFKVKCHNVKSSSDRQIIAKSASLNLMAMSVF